MPDPDHSDPLAYDVPEDVRSDKLWGYFLDYKWWFALGAGFLILTNLQQLTIPVYIGSAVTTMKDAYAGETSLAEVRPQLVWAALAIIALAVGGAVTRVLSRITIFNPGRYIEFNIRNDLYEKLTELTPSFYDSVPTGDLTSRVTNDVQKVRVFYALTFLHVVNTAVAYAIAIWRMARVDFSLTLICLAPYPFLLAGILWLSRAMFEQTKTVQAKLSDISDKCQENLTGMSVIKCFDLHERQIADFEGLNDEFFEENMELAYIRGGLNALTRMVAGVGTFMLLAVGSYRVVEGTLPLGEFVEFNGYVVALAFPTTAMGWVFGIWQRGRAAFDRVMEILARPASLTPPDEEARDELPPRERIGTCGRVEFDDVSFAYDDEPVLKDVDLTVPAGSTVAFVGRTGSGKSTLVKLLSRLYDPDEGEIRLDGVPVDELSLRQLRTAIGYVPQEPLLFSMTVRQNLRFGLDALQYDESVDRTVPQTPLLPDSDATPPLDQEERLEQAVDVAGLRPDVEAFADGLDTLVGERGVTLSGGQKQRITLARALLVDPRVLVLDDALSSVDTETERVILDYLDDLMEDRTSILLTHRFNVLDRVDRVYVLEDGEVVERGTHRQLLEADGAYAEMYRRQQLEEDLEDGE